jgi:hypothetical protein
MAFESKEKTGMGVANWIAAGMGIQEEQ